MSNWYEDHYELFGFDDEYLMSIRYKPQANYNLNSRIQLNPHYSDPKWNTTQTVWGAEEEGLNYVYSDRLSDWDYKKYKESVEIANEKATYPTAKWVQELMCAYYDKQIEVWHILAGCNCNAVTGYSYFCVGYREVENND